MSKPDRSRELRELRALVSENNFCINCRSKTPGYVCLTFSTFVCTKCAGVHRSFMHIIRSITLSSLSDSEMEQLRAGGNAVAEKVWFATWSELEEPRPSSHDENALRKFIRLAYIDKRWQAGSSSAHSASKDLSLGMAPQTSQFGGDFNFDLSSSYAASPLNGASNGNHDISIMPTQALSAEQPQALPSHFAPIDLPLSASPMDFGISSHQNGQHAGHANNGSTHNPLDLISWDERPAANSLPQAVDEVRRPVYHVQHSSTPASASSPSIAMEPPSPQYHVSHSQDARASSSPSKDPEISRLEELIATQQRQFQQQLERQQFEQQRLQQQLQQARIQQQITDHQMSMSKQLSPGNQPALLASSQVPPPSSMSPVAGKPKMYMPMMSMPTQPGYQPAGGQPTASVVRPVYQQAPTAAHSTQQPNPQTIMVLGPNGQLVPLTQAAAAVRGPPVAGASPSPPAHLHQPQPQPQHSLHPGSSPTGVGGASGGVAFTPLVTARGQAMVAPATSPLMTLGAQSPQALPPGSIGPHYVPAPGGGFQAVYMVPSGTLPPGAVKTTTPTTNRPLATSAQPAAHAPVYYGAPTSHAPGGAPSYPHLAPGASKQEQDDFALAIRLQKEEEAAAQRERAPANTGALPRPFAPPARPTSGPGDDYYSDALAANASYIANDEELARQLAAADLSDGE